MSYYSLSKGDWWICGRYLYVSHHYKEKTSYDTRINSLKREHAWFAEGSPGKSFGNICTSSSGNKEFTLIFSFTSFAALEKALTKLVPGEGVYMGEFAAM